MIDIAAAGKRVDEHRCVIRLRERPRIGLETFAQFVDVVAVGVRGVERLYRKRRLVVPVDIERARRFGHHGPDHDHVEIAKMLRFARFEIRVADVAAADDGRRVVDDERFVVHAPIQARSVDHELADLREDRWIARLERIEKPHLDVRMRVERVEHVLGVARIEIVHQQAHAHAAVGGGEQVLRDQTAGRVGIEDVVLQIDRTRGAIGEHDAAHQRIVVVGEQTEAGFVFMTRSGRGDITRRGCRLRRGERCGIRFDIARAQRRARDQPDNQCADARANRPTIFHRDNPFAAIALQPFLREADSVDGAAAAQ